MIIQYTPTTNPAISTRSIGWHDPSRYLHTISHHHHHLPRGGTTLDMHAASSPNYDGEHIDGQALEGRVHGDDGALALHDKPWRHTQAFHVRPIPQPACRLLRHRASHRMSLEMDNPLKTTRRVKNDGRTPWRTVEIKYKARVMNMDTWRVRDIRSVHFCRSSRLDPVCSTACENTPICAAFVSVTAR
jgi:hypothetical protein